MRRRWYAQARWAIPTDTAEGIAAWEAQAAKLTDYQAECETKFYDAHPEMPRPVREKIFERYEEKELVYRPLKRGS